MTASTITLPITPSSALRTNADSSLAAESPSFARTPRFRATISSRLSSSKGSICSAMNRKSRFINRTGMTAMMVCRARVPVAFASACSFRLLSRECVEVHRRAKKNAPRGRAYMILVAPQGFEPRSSESESLVLPLNEGATQLQASCSKGSLTAFTECMEMSGSGQPYEVQRIGHPQAARATRPAASPCSHRGR